MAIHADDLVKEDLLDRYVHARVRLRAVSTFEHLTEDEITDGFAALDRDAATETRPRPVEADCDLLVLGTRAWSAEAG